MAKKTTIKEFEYYYKPEIYGDGEVNKDGIKTRKVIEKLSGLKDDQLIHIGDTEDDFDYEYMEKLEDIFEDMEVVGEKTLEFEEGVVFVEVKSGNVGPVIGKIVKVWSEGLGGMQFASYFGDEWTYKAIEKGALSDSDEPEIEDAEITLVIDKELLEDLMEEFGSGSGVVIDQIKSDFRRMVSKYYLG